MSYTDTFAQSGEPSAMVAAVAWIEGALLGTVAASLCVIAVAVVGFLTLQGRLPVRLGVRVVVGCLVLLGAPVVAGGFLQVWQDGVAPPPIASFRPEDPGRKVLPVPSYDPYAGASLTRDHESVSKM